jgi:hypothetical protein
VDQPEFYVSAAGDPGGVKTDPPGAPGACFAAAVGELAPLLVLAERFEEGLPPGWQTSGLWHVTGSCPVLPTCDGVRWAYYGLEDTCDYDTGAPNSGGLMSPPLTLPILPAGGTATLAYCSTLVTEDEPGYDVAAVLANGTAIDQPEQAPAWQPRTADLTAFGGQTITLEWWFDTVDDWYNDYPGWQVDEVEVSATQLECDFTLPFVPGDVNCDGAVDAFDIDPFVLALTDPAGYDAAQPDCTRHLADTNGDGRVDAFDIDPFVKLLAGG